jgi:hypothetical protein
MKTRWLVVVRSRGEWWVDCEGKSFGPFPDPDAAAKTAVRYAEIFNDADRQSQVWMPDEHGRYRVVWEEPFGQPVRRAG